ncbi:lipin/Ned1/Smp2 family protein [Agarilytica rhodophyticola]|uniref:lipin/Ned1/Smp2 family protein n=1 Tax=Agarilytica rhodophyticola TaxID=1737490 RepID=UPI000B343C19|nr:hypothetical protein [Agarilytica rhodophyticola]
MLLIKKSMRVLSYVAIVSLSLTSGYSSANANSVNPPNPDLDPMPSVPAETIAGCPDYRGALNLPALEGPQQRSFRRLSSRYWAGKYSPYHMVHDEIANPQESIEIVGKFDYNRIFHKDLEQEYIHAYLYGTGMNDWSYLGRYKTDRDGKVYVNVPGKPEGEYIVRMIVEGDLSSADGFVSVVPRGQDTILFDIDGTLTLNDFEGIGDYFGVSTAQRWPYVKETVQTYIDKGYRVIFVTGRPYWVARDTREWFTDVIDLPQWHLRTNENSENILDLDTLGYKREYIRSIIDKGLNIVRAYGNADTDITAYEDAGIDKNETWIIGENAGRRGTQEINGDYSGHFFDVVEPSAQARCRRVSL